MKAKSSATVSPPRVQRAQRRPTQIVRVFVFIPLALLATLGGFAVSKAGGTRNSLPAGMSVAKIAIGGKRLEEVRALLEKFAEEHANTPVVFSIPNEGSTPRSWKSLAKETGLLVDVEATLADIAKMGEIGLLERMRNLFVTPTGQTISVRTRVEEDKLTQRLKRIQKIVNREPKNPRLDITQTPYAILPGKQGFTLDVPASLTAITTAWTNQITQADTNPADTLNIDLTTKETPPAITEEALRQIDGEISRYRTHYGGTGANRGENISLAASHINGTLLAPGEVFSYNKTVGPRNEKAGFKDAPVIIHGELKPGIGGGICQVSTTLYNAALLANLKIVRRSHHAFPVHYAPPGRDATVVDGSIDFKFQNDTTTPIYLYAKAAKGFLEFRLLGKRVANRVVKIVLENHTTIPNTIKETPNPKIPTGKRIIEDKGHIGHRVNVYRVVQENGVVVKRELLGKDYYRPFPAQVTVGTGAPLPPSVPNGVVPSPVVTPKPKSSTIKTTP